MNEPWISLGILGGLIGGVFGILGGLVGTLAGAFVPRGKAKKLTLVVNTFAVALGFVLFVFGIVAFLYGQPRDVLLTSVIAGLDCSAGFAICYWVILKRARDAELRKMTAEDLTLDGNKKDKEISHE